MRAIAGTKASDENNENGKTQHSMAALTEITRRLRPAYFVRDQLSQRNQLICPH
jgi:hypothetical protein